jgi:hypothetical protein
MSNEREAALPGPTVTSLQFVNQFFERMNASIGAERTRKCIDDALSATGLRQLRTPDEVVLFASNLMQRGGFFGRRAPRAGDPARRERRRTSPQGEGRGGREVLV